MQTHNLGYPRIGSKRELKKACEQYWSGKISEEGLREVGRELRLKNWQVQKEAGIDLIPSNDFSYYDQVLDMIFNLGAIPRRYSPVVQQKSNSELDLYFAMARGYQKNGLDITAMEMTKWFDTNYHYIVPEFFKDQEFSYFSSKIVNNFIEAKHQGFHTKPVILGPISFLLLGKEKEPGFHRLDLIKKLLPVYIKILKELKAHNATWVQIDEPFLAMDLDEKARETYQDVYKTIQQEIPGLKTMLTTYFEGLQDNLSLATKLSVNALHIDLVRSPQQLEEVLSHLPENMQLSLGVVDGRNIWKNDFKQSLDYIHKSIEKLGRDRIFIAPSCSLLHCPYDLDLEKNEKSLPAEIKQWMAFAKQKLTEIVKLKELSGEQINLDTSSLFKENQDAITAKNTAGIIHRAQVKKEVSEISEEDFNRQSAYATRKAKQQEHLGLPGFPTTSIGSFPQTKEVRQWRAKYKKGVLSENDYIALLKKETEKTIKIQEEIGLDVLVHGEAERNDMVEYFGERLAGVAFTQNAWVQSYGSRCVKPPIIYGDVERPEAMTVFWTVYAQSLTSKLLKGMLTGPVTILQWSFVRNDQPREETCTQIALAIRKEVQDLEKAGIKIIQIDEPALREGLPLRKKEQTKYLEWAVNAFKLSANGVKDQTQIHTHMCYSEFNDIIAHIAQMDADVITIECSRSQMELLDAFVDFNYPNAIGPGVYDIHSPRIPSKEEITQLLEKAKAVIPKDQLWVNPDCGLKTRKWEEVKDALSVMVEAAKEVREKETSPAL